MNSPTPPPSSLRIDEDWLRQWVAYGMVEMAVYLTKQAAFTAYLHSRDKRRNKPRRAQPS
jgi:hypothetical protein